MANRLGLPALFGINTGKSAGGINEGEYRQIEFLRELHQAQGLAVTLGLGHAEITHGALFGIAPFLMPDDHARLAIETRKTADNGLVICVSTVAMQLMKIGEDFIHIVHGVRTLRMTGNLRYLPGCQLGVEVFGELLAFLRKTVDFFADIDS